MRISAGVDFRPNGGMLAFARMEYVIAAAPFKQLACHFPSSLFLIAFSPGALLRSLLLYLYIVSGSPPERGVMSKRYPLPRAPGWCRAAEGFPPGLDGEKGV